MARQTRTFPTPLGYALLGEINNSPRTGYAVRKTFETSPVGRFSDSPGSIYPALKKLEAHGLIESRKDAASGKAILHLTAAGKRAFRRWLAQPVTPDDVASQYEIVILRFAFLDSVNDLDLSLRYLRSLEEALREFLDGLKAFRASEQCKALPLHGRLALDHGIAGYETSLSWARSAQKTLEQHAKQGEVG